MEKMTPAPPNADPVAVALSFGSDLQRHSWRTTSDEMVMPFG